MTITSGVYIQSITRIDLIQEEKKCDSSKNILNDFLFTRICIILLYSTSRKMRRLSTGLQFLLWVRRSPQIGVSLVPILPSCAVHDEWMRAVSSASAVVVVRQRFYCANKLVIIPGIWECIGEYISSALNHRKEFDFHSFFS